jgi:hypothetical protein
MSRRLDAYPIGGPAPIRPAGQLGYWLARWWWPAAALGGFLALLGYVLGHDDPARPGLTDHALLVLGAAAVVLVVLTRRRSYGARELTRTLTEYAIVALLVGALVTLQPAASAKRHQGAAGQPTTTTRPPLVAIVPDPERSPNLLDRAAGVARWLGDLWDRADQQTRLPPTTTTPPRRPGR